MLALQYVSFGEPRDVVMPKEVPDPHPARGEVRLRMLRSPIHNHDLATIRGVYGVRPKLPAIAGSELVGIVDETGDGVDVAPGARVACITPGAWAEYAIANASAIVPVPQNIPDDEACQLLAMPLSALVLLDELHVNAGDWIVQNAANGAVGRLLLREAAHRGVNVVNLVRSEETAERLRRFGAAHVVVTEGEWMQRVREMTDGKPIVRAIDSVGGRQSMQLQHLLADRGEIVVFGGLSADPIRLDPSLMISRELTVRGFWMMREDAGKGRMARAMQRVFELAARHELPLAVGGVYDLRDAAAALGAMETPGRTGKILFRSSDR